jgi:hypothetical protein
MAITDTQLDALVAEAQAAGAADQSADKPPYEGTTRDLASELLDRMNMEDVDWPGEFVCIDDLADAQDFRDVAAAYLRGYRA